ncbi:MAG: SurA N-terminal domain-containing protein [Armatimonadetes bacterium]|nr:SurA N-terminal domain-containing protein [Armatimonadota bacterium]MDW8122849.1 SurA N-terminal domain-containing protein [Armatimonadota bacterium]
MPSLRRTRKMMQRNLIRFTLWLSIFVIFVVGTFTTFGFLEGPATGINLSPSVAKVNGWDISREEFEKALAAHIAQRRPEAGDWMEVKQAVLDELILDTLIQQEAQRRGVRVTGADLEQFIDLRVQLEMSAVRDRFAKSKAFRDFIRDRFGSLNGYERALKDQYWQNRWQDQKQILFNKLMTSVMEEVTVTDADLERSYTRYRIQPLLIDWIRFLPKGKEGLEEERKKAEERALERAKELRQRLGKGEAFLSVAAEAMGQKDLKKEPAPETVSFESLEMRFGEDGAKVIAQLKEGEVSEPIKTPAGAYLVRLVSKKVEWPKDIDTVRYQCEEQKCRHTWQARTEPKECPKCRSKKIKKVSDRREELKSQLRQMKGQQRWFQLMERLRREAQVEIYDWDLMAADRARSGQREESLQAYREVLKQIRDETFARRHYILPEAIYYEMGRLLADEGKYEEAEKATRRALEYTGEDYSVLLQLGHILLKKGNKEAALKVLQRVSSGSPQPHQRRQLAIFYEEAGRKDLAQKERKEAERMEKESVPSFLTQ